MKSYKVENSSTESSFSVLMRKDPREGQGQNHPHLMTSRKSEVRLKSINSEGKRGDSGELSDLKYN